MIVATSTLAACAQPPQARGSDYCMPPTTRAPPFTIDPPAPPDAPREEQMATLLGLHSLYAAGARDETTRVRMLARIQEARLVVTTTAAELACESDRSREAADNLVRSQSNAAQKLTVGSIATSSVTAVASVYLSTTNTSAVLQDSFAVGGGALAAGFGIASLYVHPHVDFRHPRNLLGDVWRGPSESTVYPPFLWDYLTELPFGGDAHVSLREKIVDRWRHSEGLKGNAIAITLLFGDGGAYDADVLRLRAAMLDEVRAQIELANLDIAALESHLLALP